MKNVSNDYVVIIIYEIYALEMWWCTIIIFVDVSCTLSLYIIIVKGWERPLCVDLDG